MLLDHFRGFGNLLRFDPIVRVEFNRRFNPELRFAIGMLDMHMWPAFLTRKEVEPKPSNAQDRRTHPYRIADLRRRQDFDPRSSQREQVDSENTPLVQAGQAAFDTCELTVGDETWVESIRLSARLRRQTREVCQHTPPLPLLFDKHA